MCPFFRLLLWVNVYLPRACYGEWHYFVETLKTLKRYLLNEYLMGEVPNSSQISQFWTSSQDRGVGRYTLPPHTTKRTTTNLKKKNNQNFQKIELYGSPTTKELKKKYSFRPVGGTGRGSQGGEDSWKDGGWRTGWGSSWRSGQSHICVHINQEEQLGTQTDCTTQGSSVVK